MATSNADLGFPSLLNSLKLLKPDGRGYQTELVEMLSKFNPLLQDSAWKEGNLPTGERIAQRVGLPTIGPRQFNVGVTPSRSTFGQFDEPCALIAAWSTIDKDLADLEGDAAAYRAIQDKGFVIQFMNTIESYFFTASLASNPLLFNGFTPRFASSTGVGTGKQVVKVDPAASGAHESSIWLIGWGLETCYCIYPRGTMGGLQAKVYDELPVAPASNGAYMPGYQTYWKWQVGLALKDPRFVSRMCNFDSVDATTTADLIIPAMIFGYHNIYNPNAARFAWYCNRYTGSYLHQQARNKTQYQLRVEEPGGQPIISMMGIPIRITDALPTNESTVS